MSSISTSNRPPPLREIPAEAAPWHLLGIEETALQLGVVPERGLEEAEALRRLQVYGPNEIQEARRRSPLRMLLDQFADFMILVLIAAGIITGLIGEPQDAVAIVVIVILNAVIGFVQEYRAQRAVAALKRLAAPSCAGTPRWAGVDAPGAGVGARRCGAAGSGQRSSGRPALARGGPAQGGGGG